MEKEKGKKNRKRWEEEKLRRDRDVGILKFRTASETNLAQIGLSTQAHWL